MLLLTHPIKKKANSRLEHPVSLPMFDLVCLKARLDAVIQALNPRHVAELHPWADLVNEAIVHLDDIEKAGRERVGPKGAP